MNKIFVILVGLVLIACSNQRGISADAPEYRQGMVYENLVASVDDAGGRLDPDRGIVRIQDGCRVIYVSGAVKRDGVYLTNYRGTSIAVSDVDCK